MVTFAVIFLYKVYYYKLSHTVESNFFLCSSLFFSFKRRIQCLNFKYIFLNMGFDRNQYKYNIFKMKIILDAEFPYQLSMMKILYIWIRCLWIRFVPIKTSNMFKNSFLCDLWHILVSHSLGKFCQNSNTISWHLLLSTCLYEYKKCN